MNICRLSVILIQNPLTTWSHMYLEKPFAAGDNLKVTADQRELKNRYAENAN